MHPRGAHVYRYGTVLVSGYLTIRNIRRLFYGIWIYLDHPHQLSVSTRWQNSHYPVNPDGAGASRIHALPDFDRTIVTCGKETVYVHVLYMTETRELK